MINQTDINNAVITGLELTLECPVIFANQTAPAPPYPYCSFTITNLMGNDTGTYGLHSDNVYRKSIIQTWSFTIQSDDDDEAMKLALKAFDFFSLTGKLILAENKIVVQQVYQINNRDNLITIEQEHRYGFDVKLALCNEIETCDFGEIDEVDFDEFIIKTN